MSVLHSSWGLNDFFKGFCDRFGEAGFGVMAPDLYAGEVVGNVAQARQLRTTAKATRGFCCTLPIPTTGFRPPA